MKVTLNPSTRNLTRTNVLQALPPGDPNRELFEKSSVENVPEMIRRFGETHPDGLGKALDVSNAVAGVGFLGFVGGLVGMLGGFPTAGAAGVAAGLTLFAGSQVGLHAHRNREAKKNAEVRAQLTETANAVSQDRLSQQGGQIVDRTFIADFAFQNPTEIRDAQSERVLSRSVTIAGAQPVTIREDVGAESVTMQWGDQKVTLPGTLELPDFSNYGVARVNVSHGLEGFDGLSSVHYVFDREGKLSVGAGNDRMQVKAGDADYSQLNQDGSIYLQNSYSSRWYAVQPAALPGAPTGSHPAGQLTVTPPVASELTITGDVDHAPLETSRLTPLRPARRPEHGRFGDVTITNRGNTVEIDDGESSRRYPGALHWDGTLVAGDVKQLLVAPDVQDLEVSVPKGGKIHLSYSEEEGLDVSYQKKNGKAGNADAKLNADGSYTVRYEGGGRVQVQPPVPLQNRS